MSFIQFPAITPVFPTLAPLTWSTHKEPSFKSTVSKAVTGRETQLIRAVYPRWEFTLSYGEDAWLREETQNILPDPRLLGKTELQQISGLFLQCFGAFGEFYYLDPNDNSRIIGLGDNDAVTTVYPLFYTWGTGPFTPSFTAPVSGIESIISVYIGTTLQDPSTYGVDSTNTQLVFVEPPPLALIGQPITVAFIFYFRCRFLTDMQEYDQWAKNLWENKEVTFQSVKP